MDIGAAFISSEGWRAILVTINGLEPYLLIALGLMILWNRRPLNRHEDKDDSQSEGRRGWQAAEDPSDYDDELGDRDSDEEKSKLPHPPDEPSSNKRKNGHSPIRRSLGINSFIGILGICWGVMQVLYPMLPLQPEPPLPYQPVQPKNREETLFEAKVIDANQHRARGDAENAMIANREAMKFPNIPINENAVPLVNVAEMLLEQGLIDRAYWPALIASGLRSDDPDFVNPFAEVLIKTCELDDALDQLDGLGERKDERSIQLLERADVRRSQCTER